MKSIIRNLVAVPIIAAAAATTFAQADGGGRLRGNWDVVVTPRVCATGAPITTFKASYNFDRGGVMSGVSAGTGSGGRGRENVGLWRYEGEGQYRLRIKQYLFDAAGVATGYQIVTHQIGLEGDDLASLSVGLSQSFNLQGVQTATGCSTIVAQRATDL